MTRSLRDQLISDHINLVRFAAIQVIRRLASNIDMDDLISYGYVGLIEAANRFDPGRGLKFTTYAHYRIKGAIYDGLRTMGWLGRAEYQSSYSQKQPMRPSSPSKVRVRTPIFIDELSETDVCTNEESRLANGYVSHIDGELLTYIEDRQPTSAECVVESQQTQQLVREAIERLPMRERTLVRLYYYQDWPLEKVGQELGFSKSWTCRLHRRSIKNLARLLTYLRLREP